MAIISNHFKTRLVRYPVIALGVLAAGILTGLRYDLSRADWGAWVGSIGTVGTLIGTVWLATSESRRRRFEELARAHIVAAALAPRISLLRSELEGIEFSLAFPDEETGLRELPSVEASNFLASNYTAATSDELLVLTALRGNWASQLAYAQSQRSIVQHLIQNYIENYDDGQSPLDNQTAAEWENMICGLRHRFQAVERRFVSIARVHAREPDGEELYGS